MRASWVAGIAMMTMIAMGFIYSLLGAFAGAGIEMAFAVAILLVSPRGG